MDATCTDGGRGADGTECKADRECYRFKATQRENRMSQNMGSGIFGLSVDVSSSYTQGSPTRGSQSELAGLLSMLHRLQIPATFATPTPGCDGFFEPIRDEPVRHELAILADESWVGPGVGRTKFARELASRVESAKLSGASVHTLAINGAELTENLDLLVKHQISVVRSSANRGFEPQSLRFGVWQAPVSFTLPSTGRWQFGGNEWAVNRALTRATKCSGLVHLVVSLEALCDKQEAAALERVLATVNRRRSKQQVSVLTMRGVVARLAPQRAASAKSVLRVA